MARGVIYVMTSSADGMVKIGKTNTKQFESRMYILERNGYYNVGNLQRKYAIEVDDFDEKEKLLHSLFAGKRIGNSELFAVDCELVISLLKAFAGRQIYPVKDENDKFEKRCVAKQSGDVKKDVSLDDIEISVFRFLDLMLIDEYDDSYKDEPGVFNNDIPLCSLSMVPVKYLYELYLVWSENNYGDKHMRMMRFKSLMTVWISEHSDLWRYVNDVFTFSLDSNCESSQRALFLWGEKTSFGLKHNDSWSNSEWKKDQYHFCQRDVDKSYRGRLIRVK